MTEEIKEREFWERAEANILKEKRKRFLVEYEKLCYKYNIKLESNHKSMWVGESVVGREDINWHIELIKDESCLLESDK